MTTAHGAEWGRFRAEAPDLAARIHSRFEANLHHVLATIRPDGSPRLSGTEVYIDDESVQVGMMPEAHKVADVRRDPRVELHSAPLDDELSGGDAKLSGRLVEHGPAGEVPGTMYRLLIERASLVRVDNDELVFTVWSPGTDVRELRRT